MPPPFERSVFINCPFDENFAPILQAIAFCVCDLGFFPRLAPENPDSAANRLDRVLDLVRGSKYGIHDLSRCKPETADEFARMNMPFELGLDHGCCRYGQAPLDEKSLLVLEHTRYDYRHFLSDIAGWDIQAHKGDHIIAVRAVNSWLQRQASAERIGAAKIMGNYAAFQEWYWEREQALGASKDDIQAYPTIQMIEAMAEWIGAGRPM